MGINLDPNLSSRNVCSAGNIFPSLKYKDQNQHLTPNPHFIYAQISATTNPIEKRNYSGKLRTFFLDLFNLVRRLSFSILSLGLAILFLYKRLKGFHS